MNCRDIGWLVSTQAQMTTGIHDNTDVEIRI